MIHITAMAPPDDMLFDEMERRYVFLLMDCPHNAKGPALYVSQHRLIEHDPSLLKWVRKHMRTQCCRKCDLDPAWLLKIIPALTA